MEVEFNKNSVLIVDDEPENIQLVSDILSLQKIKTLSASNGEEGNKSAQKNLPDLILLDVRMPGLDGYETCQQLQSNIATQNIPIIFMTGLTELENKLKAFSVGGVDYVTKPFRRPELLARVCVHLRIHNLQKELAEKNERLESAIDTSKVVNVAIGVLIERRKISSEEAYENIRSQARSQRRKVAEVALEVLANN